MNTVTFAENVRNLRKSSGMSQEELAARLGVSAQAVSKWECGMSYPDIELLIALADVFGVTVDRLLRGEDAATPCDFGADLPDDGKLRVVQLMGQKMLSVNDIDPENVIPLHIDSECTDVNVEIWGSATIDGDVGGNVTANVPKNANANISCGDVGGGVHTDAGHIDCGDVGGNAHTNSGHIDCGDIRGDASTNAGSFKCGNIGGDAHTGAGAINCGDISGSAHTNVGNIKCSSHG